MHHFGFVRAAAGVPVRYRPGEAALLREHRQLISAAIERDVELLVFPFMSLAGAWDSSDLFQDDMLLSVTGQLSDLVSFTAESDLVTVVGMPVLCRNVVYQAAVVFQRGAILGVIPQIQAYDSDGASGHTASDITLLGQTVPFSPNIIIRTKSYAMGVIVGNCDVVSAANSLSQQGATLLAQMDACGFAVGDGETKKALLAGISAQMHTGYLYVNAGAGRGGQMLTCAGNCYLFEEGVLLKESAQFSGRSTLLIGEIDQQAVKKRRRAAGVHSAPCIEAVAADSQWELRQLTRPLSPTPYLVRPAEALEEVLQVQSAALCSRLNAQPNAKLCLLAAGSVNTALAMLACSRVVQQTGLPKEQVTVVISDDMRDLKGASACDLMELAKKLELPVSNQAEKSGIFISTSDLSDTAFGLPAGRGLAINTALPKMAIYRMLEAANLDLPKGILQLPLSEKGRVAYDFFLYFRLRYGFEREKLLFLAEHAFRISFDRRQIETMYQYFDQHCIPVGEIVRRMGQDILGILC